MTRRAVTGGSYAPIGPFAVLFVLLMAAYSANLRQVSSMDTYAARWLPIAILRDGTLHLDRFAEVGPDGQLRYYFTRSGEHVYDSYPPIAPLFALPVYAVPVWLSTPHDERVLGNLCAKLAASSMAALSACTLYLLLFELGVSRSTRWVAAVVYGLGTSVWSTASQGLWTHGPTVLCFALALRWLAHGRVAAATAAAAIGVISRPATLVVLAPILAAGFALDEPGGRFDRSGLLSFARALPAYATRKGFAAFAILVAGIAYNLMIFGSVVGSAESRTANWTQEFGARSMFDGSMPLGVAGLLVSPGRGLLVFSPVMIFALSGAWRAWRSSLDADRTLTVLARMSSACFVLVLLVYAQYLVWWGGHGYGPRYLTDVMPFAAILFATEMERTAPSASNWLRRAAIALLLVYSIGVQAIGAFCWPSSWTLDKDHPYRFRLWDWRENEILACLREGPHLDPAARAVLTRAHLLPRAVASP